MNERASLLVIVNHAAARAREAWPRVREALAGGVVRFDGHESVRPGETEERTRAALGEGYTTVAVVGGDGTLSAAASGYFEPCAGLSESRDELVETRDGLVDMRDGIAESRDGVRESGGPRAVNPAAALAVLPAGTGDDFARGLAGGRREPLEAWLARLVKHCRRTAGDISDETGNSVSDETGGSIHSDAGFHSDAGVHSEETGVGFPSDKSAVEGAAGFQRPATTRDVDVLLGSADAGARRFVCLNAATLGIGAEVAWRVASQGTSVRRLSGEARFAWAAVQSLAAWRNRGVRVSVDGRVWAECETNLIAVVNGAYAGGGMNFSPAARVDDRLLDVLTVCGISRAGLVRELARIHGGGHLSNPQVRLTRGTHVRIETADGADSLGVEADGDVRGRTPVEFRVLPAALRVVF
jgi:diacylglycerol kinase family enzyme